MAAYPRLRFINPFQDMFNWRKDNIYMYLWNIIHIFVLYVTIIRLTALQENGLYDLLVNGEFLDETTKGSVTCIMNVLSLLCCLWHIYTRMMHIRNRNKCIYTMCICSKSQQLNAEQKYLEHKCIVSNLRTDCHVSICYLVSKTHV